MAIESNATIIYLSPVPASVRERFHQIADEMGFSADHGEAPIDTRKLKDGLTVVRADGLGSDHAERLIALAKEGGFSLAVHIDYFKDYESEVKAALDFYDHTDGREGSVPAECNTMVQMIDLKDVAQVLGKINAGALQRLRKHYLPPADLLPAFAGII